MGSCNSAQAGLEQRCGRQMKRNRKGRSTSSSSSSSSSSLSLNNQPINKGKTITATTTTNVDESNEKQKQKQNKTENENENKNERGPLIRESEQVQNDVNVVDGNKENKLQVKGRDEQILRKGGKKGEESSDSNRIFTSLSGQEQDNKTNKDSEAKKINGEKVAKATADEDGNEEAKHGRKEKIEVEVDAKEKENDVNEKKRSKLDVLKEGVDFIETEEDVEAVESAVVKIQSTFRGKKIRSKLGQKAEAKEGSGSKENTTALKQSNTKADSSKEGGSSNNKSSATKQVSTDEELNKKVANMQVNDNSHDASKQQATSATNALPVANLPEDAERAATKIQAGFKGYKTRKELEGKLGGQQGAPQAGANSENEALQDITGS